MTNKLRQNATASTRGTIYQLGVAVEKCYQLRINQKLIIEEIGDITTDDIQYEIKQYSDSLTDGHHNFWNTVFNWMDEKFDHDQYSALILHTTQEFGKNSQLKNWNSSDAQQRLNILELINKNHSIKHGEKLKKNPSASMSNILNTQNQILSSSIRSKLISILPKIWIESQSETLPDLYSKIKEVYIKGILLDKKDDFLNSLIGYVCRPGMKPGERWTISYDEWDSKVGDLISVFSKATKVFPKKYFLEKNESDVLKYKSEDLFIKKIKDIEHDHEVICDAISSYQATVDTISYYFREYSFYMDELKIYDEQIMNQYFSKYRTYTRKCKSVDDVIIESQNLYDELTSDVAAIYPCFDDTPMYFRNGLYHINMNDKNKKHQWKIIKK